MIVFPSNTSEIIDAIRNAIGRGIDCEIPTVSGCTTCSLDPVTNTSTNSFCPVCSGVYWITAWDVVTISGHVSWRSDGDLDWVTGGRLFDGDCTVQIKYSEDNLQYIEDAKYFRVDGKRMYKDKTVLRGFPTLNRIIVVMKEQDDEIDSD